MTPRVTLRRFLADPELLGTALASRTWTACRHGYSRRRQHEVPLNPDQRRSDLEDNKYRARLTTLLVTQLRRFIVRKQVRCRVCIVAKRILEQLMPMQN
jgi:hypothetical protein